MRIKDILAENKIKLSTDPNWYGAEIGDFKAAGPILNIPTSRLVGFEPDEKMNEPDSKANIEKIVAGLKQGAKLPPILVRKYKNGYQVLDGHHRFWAHKLLGRKSIPAHLVPDSDIIESADNLNYCGNCTDDDVIERIFGDATGFAQAVEEYGDEFTLDDLVVKYDPDADVHSFYYKNQE